MRVTLILRVKLAAAQNLFMCSNRCTCFVWE